MFQGFSKPVKDNKNRSNIWSIQRGTYTLTTTSGDVTITAVDTSRSIVRVTSSVVYTNAEAFTGNAKLLNSTTIRFQKGAENNDVTFKWEVITFNGVKSLQSGAVTVTTGSTVTINSINTAKSLLFYSCYHAGAVGDAFEYKRLFTATITNATTLTFAPDATNDVNIFVEWQVIEFN